MEFIVNYQVWILPAILGIVATISLAAVIFLLVQRERMPFLVAFAVFAVTAVAGMTTAMQTTANENTRFSEQLQKEYGAVSSVPYAELYDKLAEHGEAATTLSRDGVDTEVFVKSIKVEGTDQKTVRFIFTEINENSLYPKVQS